MRVARAHRRRLLVAGVVPLVASLAFAGHVGLVHLGTATGTEALARGDSDLARRSFGAINTPVNRLETWIAPYNEGVAAYRQEDLPAALRLFGTALERVPTDEECRVRSNLALAAEARADELGKAERAESRVLLDDAREVLGPCVDDAPRPAADPLLRSLPEPARAALVAQDARLLASIIEAAEEPAAPPRTVESVTGRDADFADLGPEEQQEVLEQRNELGQEERQRERGEGDRARDRRFQEQLDYNW
jgi:hypothetical protein